MRKHHVLAGGLLATLLATLAPAAHAATTRRETFEDGLAQGWTPQDPSAWSVVAETATNHVYRVQTAATELLIETQVATLAKAFQDFSYAVTVANGGQQAYVIARATADFGSGIDLLHGGGRYDGTGYAFGIACDGGGQGAGHMRAYKVVNGMYSPIFNGTPVSGLKCGATITNGDRIGISAQGAALSFHINGKKVATYQDPAPILSGLVGFYNLSNPDGISSADFDDVVITAP